MAPRAPAKPRPTSPTSARAAAADIHKRQAWALFVRGAEVEQIAGALGRPVATVDRWINAHAATPDELRDRRYLEQLRLQLQALNAALLSASPQRRAQLVSSIGRAQKRIYDLERKIQDLDEGPAGVTGEREPVKGAFTVAHFVAWAKGVILDTELPWSLEAFELNFIGDLFEGRKENWFILPEGNGKTTLVAGLVLYHCEFRYGGYAPVGASSRDQAEVLYRQAEGMVDRTARLDAERGGLFECQEGCRRIKCRPMRSRIQIYAADAGTGDGVIPTLAIVEEMHRQDDLSLYRTWMGKMRKRKGAQIVGISTAGEPGSDFELTREKIRLMPGAKRQGAFLRVATPQIVMHDWAVPAKRDITDMDVVKEANPFSGITPETLRADFTSPTMILTHWARFKANQATHLVESSVSESEWEKARVDDEIPEQQPIWVGLDIGWKWDTTALVPLWLRDPRYRLFGKPTVLVPPMDGNSLDPHKIEDALAKINARNPIHTVVMDPTRAETIAAWIVEHLQATVIEWAQTDRFEELDYERFMDALRNQYLKHPGDPTFTRHVMNAVNKQTRSGLTRFERRVASRRKPQSQQQRVIDALTAAAMVHSRAVEDLKHEEATPLIAWGRR